MNSSDWLITKTDCAGCRLSLRRLLQQAGWMKTLVLFTCLPLCLLLGVHSPSCTAPSSPSFLDYFRVGWLNPWALVGVCIVCIGAPRAHAKWGPKGKAFHTDLSQLPWFKHFITRVEERGNPHAPPPRQCAQSTLGKAASGSTNNRWAAETGKFLNLLLSF